MLDIIVQSQPDNNFISAISFAADMCILVITLYTTYKTFIDKKIKLLTYTPHFWNMFGGMFISVVVENTSLSPLSVEKIDIVYDNHYVINIAKYNEPLILKPQHATAITMEPFSELAGVSTDEIDNKDFYLIFSTSKGKIISNFKRMPVKHKRNNIYQTVSVMRKFFNGIILTPDIKYAILMEIDGGQKIILLNDGGLMDKDIYGYNAIPREDIDNIDMVKTHIKGIIDQYNPGQKFALIQIKNIF